MADKRVPPRSKDRNLSFIFRNIAWLPFCSLEFIYGYSSFYYWLKTLDHSVRLNLTLPTAIHEGNQISFYDDSTVENFIPFCVTAFILLVDFFLICHCLLEFIILYSSHVRIMILSIYVPTDILAEKVYNWIVSRRNNSGGSISPITMSRLLFCQCVSVLIILLLTDDWSAIVHGNIFSSNSCINATVNTTRTLAGYVGKTFQFSSQTDVAFGTFVLSSIFVLLFVMLEYHLVRQLLLSKSASVRASCLRDMNVVDDLARRLSTELDFREMELVLALKREDIMPKLYQLLVVYGGKTYVVKSNYLATISYRCSQASGGHFQFV